MAARARTAAGITMGGRRHRRILGSRWPMGMFYVFLNYPLCVIVCVSLFAFYDNMRFIASLQVLRYLQIMRKVHIVILLFWIAYSNSWVFTILDLTFRTLFDTLFAHTYYSGLLITGIPNLTPCRNYFSRTKKIWLLKLKLFGITFYRFY